MFFGNRLHLIIPLLCIKPNLLHIDTNRLQTARQMLHHLLNWVFCCFFRQHLIESEDSRVLLLNNCLHLRYLIWVAWQYFRLSIVCCFKLTWRRHLRYLLLKFLDIAPFQRFHHFLSQCFDIVSTVMESHIVSIYSLLYRVDLLLQLCLRSSMVCLCHEQFLFSILDRICYQPFRLDHTFV